MLDDKIYNNRLDIHLNKYPDTSESDYIKAQIYNCRKRIESIETKSEYYIQQEAIQKVGNEPYEKVIHQIKIVIANDISKIANLRKEIVFYKTRLSRLQSMRQTKTIDTNTKKKSLPYQIALLNEVGFFELEYFKKLTQKKVNEITSKILNTQPRSVSGNISALQDKNIGHQKYTSYKHIESVKKYLNQS